MPRQKAELRIETKYGVGDVATVLTSSDESGLWGRYLIYLDVPSAHVHEIGRLLRDRPVTEILLGEPYDT